MATWRGSTRYEQEVEALTLYKSIVEDGPDLFSLHNPTTDAPFSFLCENFYARLRLTPEEILGRPLATIVDPRDVYALTSTLYQVIEHGGRGGPASNGLFLQVRLIYRGIMCQASMTVVWGSHGIMIILRLRGAWL